MRGGTGVPAIYVALVVAAAACDRPTPQRAITGRAQTVSGTALPGIAVRAHGPDGDVETVTGLDGSFRLEALRPGTYDIELADPWVLPARREEKVELGTFTDLGPLEFTAVGRVSGRITVSPPRSLTPVVVSTVDGAAHGGVDVDGNFSFLVPTGTHQLVARLGAAAKGTEATVPWRGEVSVDLSLSPNTSPLNVPRFRYVDRTTHEGISVHLHATTLEGAVYDEDALTFADGSIEVPGCPRGTVALTASAPGYGTATASALVCPAWEEAAPATKDVVLYRGERFGPTAYQWAAATDQRAVVANGQTVYAFPNPSPFTVQATTGTVLPGGTPTRFLISQGTGDAIGVVDLALRRGTVVKGSMRDFAVRPDLSVLFTENPYPLLVDLDRQLAGAADATLSLSDGGSLVGTRRGCFHLGGAWRDRVEPFDLSSAGTAAWTSLDKTTSLHVREPGGTVVASPVFRPDFISFADETVVFEAASALDVTVARPTLFTASKASGWAPSALTEVTACSAVYLAADRQHLLVEGAPASWALWGLDGRKVRDLGPGQVVTSGKGRRLLFSTPQGALVQDLLSGGPFALAHPAGQFTNNLFSPSEEALAYLSPVGNLAHLRLFDLASGRDDDLGEVAPDAQLRFTEDSGYLVFDSATRVEAVPLDGHTPPVPLGAGKLLGLSAKGRFAATSDGASFTVTTLDGATTYSFPWVVASPPSLAFTPDDAAVAVRLKTRDLVLVDLRTGTAFTLDGTVDHFAVLATTPPTVIFDVADKARAGLYQYVVR